MVNQFITLLAPAALVGIGVLVAGWRTTLSDAPGVTLVIWVCGCNLRCPFCHNWRIADGDPEVCADVRAERLIEEIRRLRALVDYVQVSGGEPLLYAAELASVYEAAKELGLRTSLNSNLTMPGPLRKILDLLDHVATDVKIPHLMYGLERWERPFEGFLESLRVLSERPSVELELRVPVVRAPTPFYARVFEVVGEVLGDRGNCRVVPRRIYGRPVVVPRSSEWCETFCADSDYEQRAAEVESLARVYLRSCRTMRQ